MATYNGSSIFGYGVQINTVTNPLAVQLNAFFGLNNQQLMMGGLRGRYTTVQGVLYGSSAANLNTAIGLFESYVDGVARTLVDTFGNAWPQVILERFEPFGKIRQHADGSYWKEYKAGFQHLI